MVFSADILALGFFFTLMAGKGSCQAFSLKEGKANVTVKPPNFYACEAVLFDAPFLGKQDVQVFASPGHALNSSVPRYGAAVWVTAVTTYGFTVCIQEFGEGSNGTTEVNWIAVQSISSGAFVGTASFQDWTTGTNCKKVEFSQRFSRPPTVLASASHQSSRPQDAMVTWTEDVQADKFKICLHETKVFAGHHKNIKVDWLAFVDPPVNFTRIGGLNFTNISSASERDNFALCETIKFAEKLFVPPVVVVTPKCKSNKAISSSHGCDVVTAWVEYVSTTDTKLCTRSYDQDTGNNVVLTVDYAVIGDLDPCLNITCHYYGQCKVFGAHDARCICLDRCPSFEEPVCSSAGKTYSNKCLFEKEMCTMRYNFSLQHPGSCEGFPFQRGRVRIQNIPLMGDSSCEEISFRPYVFYPDKAILVQITVNHFNTSDNSYVHDAAVSWVENVGNDNFSACVTVAGMNERKRAGDVTVDWMAYQGAPVGGVAGEVRISKWWTGTTCKTVNLPMGKFSISPSVFVTSKRNGTGLKRDAASVWIENGTQSSFKVCLRELQNYAGAHEDIYINWLAFSDLHQPIFSEHGSVNFANALPPPDEYNGAYCKDVSFNKTYNNTPSVFVTANHSTSGRNVDPVHNGITAWIEYITTTGFKACLKELYVTRYDPLAVSFTVLSDICDPGWGYFNHYCYFTSTSCASWLSAEAKCTAMGAHLVTVHNQEENVYIQRRHNGHHSWIGLNDRSVENYFVWPSRDTSWFRYWATNQPNNFRGEDCVHTLGMGHGYRWNDVSCSNCYNFTCAKDLDECALNANNCSVNAVCLNSQGSYSCSCKAGLVGDGRYCGVDKVFSTGGRKGRYGVIQQYVTPYTGLYTIKAGGARGGNHTYNYGYNPGTYYGGYGGTIQGTYSLTKGTVLNIVVGQRGGDSVEVQGGQMTNMTAAQLGRSVEDNAGTGGGGGSFVYTTSNYLLLAAGGGGGASAGYNGVAGQAGTSGSSSVGKTSSQVRSGGSGGQPGQCNNRDASYHGGVGAGWYGQGCPRASTSHGERGGSRVEGWVGGRAGAMNSGYNGGPAPGAVGGFGGGGGGSEDNGASGGGGGYSGGGSGTHPNQAGGGGGSYCGGSSCIRLTGGNKKDDGFVEIIFH